jgi:hypothetical protein
LNPQDSDDEEQNQTSNGTSSSSPDRQPLLQPGQTLPAYSGQQGESHTENNTQEQVKETAKKIGYSIQDFCASSSTAV